MHVFDLPWLDGFWLGSTLRVTLTVTSNDRLDFHLSKSMSLKRCLSERQTKRRKDVKVMEERSKNKICRWRGWKVKT